MGSEACLVATVRRAFSKYSFALRRRPFPWRPESLPRRRPMQTAPLRQERERELPRPSGLRAWACSFCLRWAQSMNDSRRQARYRPQGSSRSPPGWMIHDAVKCPNAFQSSNATCNGLAPYLVACGSKLVQSLRPNFVAATGKRAILLPCLPCDTAALGNAPQARFLPLAMHLLRVILCRDAAGAGETMPMCIRTYATCIIFQMGLAVIFGGSAAHAQNAPALSIALKSGESSELTDIYWCRIASRC